MYQNRVQSLVKDRLSTKDKQISDMQKKENTGNQIFALIANKYNVQPDDLDGLLKAVSEDKDLFAEKALAAGMTTEEARNKVKSGSERRILKFLFKVEVWKFLHRFRLRRQLRLLSRRHADLR